ncbi:MAG: hypothetical protein KDD69_14235 [Bdellovibrionales bacterium]|nr:hypothetical protein [Bdellovibrionales bacterium]
MRKHAHHNLAQEAQDDQRRGPLDTHAERTLEKPPFRAGSSLSLVDWLQVSWFYPEGFQVEQVIETVRSLVVIGPSVVYKFAKLSVSPFSDSFADNWRWVCEEINRNRELSPDLFLGVRLLRWIEDEPYWMTELRVKDLDPAVPPVGADLAAVVMRRIPGASRLATRLAEDEELPFHQLRSLVSSLVRFHRSKSRAGIERHRRSTVKEGGGTLESATWAVIEQFGRTHTSFLDPFSQAALRESRNFLHAFRTEHGRLFEERAEQGFVIDGHGALRAEHICFAPLAEQGRALSIFGRATGARRDEAADVLADLAMLSIDLRVRNAVWLAEETERRYFEQWPEAKHDELYRYYCVCAALRRAMELLRDGPAVDGYEAVALLAVSFRFALGFPTGFLIGVSDCSWEASDGETEGSGLGQALSELLGAELLSAARCAPTIPGYVETPELMFERILMAASAEAHDGRPVVVSWPFGSEEQRLRFARLAAQSDCPHLLVKCVPGEAERLRRTLSGIQRTGISVEPDPTLMLESLHSWANPAPDELEQMVVEAVLPPVELALHVLGELVLRRRRRR